MHEKIEKQREKIAKQNDNINNLLVRKLGYRHVYMCIPPPDLAHLPPT